MSGKTALVVDDSKSARFAMRKYLEGFGFAVETAEGAEEGLAILARSAPSILFLDHIMPGVDGFEMLRRLRESNQLGQQPIVLCSSNEGDAFAAEARSLGVNEILQKPPTPEQLRAMVEKLGRGELTMGAAPSRAPTAPPPTPPAANMPAPNSLRLRFRGDWAVPAGRSQPAPPSAAPPPAASSTLHFKNLPSSPSLSEPPKPAAELLAPRSTDPDIRIDNLRNEVNLRMRRVTQELFAQMGEVKSQVSRLDTVLRETARQGDVASGTTTAAVRDQIEGIATQVEAVTQQLRKELDSALTMQNQRLDEFAAQLRSSVIAEAQAAFETALQDAVKRTADEIRASVLDSLGARGIAAP